MLIDCPACARSYHVSSAEIGESGRTVICPRCDAHWFVYGDGTNTLMPLPHDLRTPSFSARPAVMPVDEAGAAQSSLWGIVRTAVASVACLALAGAALGGRDRIVHLEPRMAGLYARIGLPVNVRGLEIATLSPERPDSSGLIVSGTIRNVVQRRVVVPRIVYEVRDTEGAPLATWTEKPPGRTLGTGKIMTFVSSPHEMPLDGRSVLVRFETDDDPVAPIHLARRTN